MYSYRRMVVVSVVILLTAVVNVKLQVFPFQDFLNNITVTDLSNVLRQLPIPHPLSFDGLPVRVNEVTYYLYTRRNPDVPVRLIRGNSLAALNRTHPVKFLIHGWLESANRSYYRGFIDAYLQRGDYNVIGVDWQRPAFSEYSISSRNTKTVGRELARFILQMNQSAGIPFQQVHILGHSLGAHLGGFAGREITRRTGNRIARISALDAAGPLYETPIPVGEVHRLRSSDAEFVDCIHTDGGIFGMIQPIGHADFYPNGGLPRQPGCSMINIRQLSSRVILEDMFCSHSRSHELFTESINSNRLRATACDSYENFKANLCMGRTVVQLGEDIDTNARGTFYLDTNANRPFVTTA